MGHPSLLNNFVIVTLFLIVIFGLTESIKIDKTDSLETDESDSSNNDGNNAETDDGHRGSGRKGKSKLKFLLPLLLSLSLLL
jgi:hypothetical protein